MRSGLSVFNAAELGADRYTVPCLQRCDRRGTVLIPVASHAIADFFLLAVTFVLADHAFFLAAVASILTLVQPATLVASLLMIVVTGQLQVGG